MERRDSDAVRDIILSSALIVLSTVVLLAARIIPHRGYDLLGAPFLPRALAVGIGVLSLGLLVKSVIVVLQARSAVRPGEQQQPVDQKEQEEEAKQEHAEPRFRDRPGVAWGLVILTTIYIAVLGSRVVSYAIATTAFVIVTASMMSVFEQPRNRLVRLAAIVVTAVALAYGLQYIFTEVFITDLP